MLARDFIDDSLYNPHYGYFSRHAVLLPEDRKRGRLLDLAAYKDERAFMMAIEERYQAFEDELKSQDERSTVAEGASSGESTSPTAGKEPLSKPSPKPQGSSPQSPAPKRRVSQPMPGSRESLERAQLMGKLDQARRRLSAKEAGEHDRDVKAMAARQVWHTPTQLFKVRALVWQKMVKRTHQTQSSTYILPPQPHYAHAIARYMLEEKEADKPLRVYEVGAGSGALASDILDFVENTHPEIYASMQYHIIEISPRLAEQQQRALARHISAGRAEVTNKSVFDWNTMEPDACFFIALEVFDNLTHDVVRYTTDTLQPYQAVVSIDASGDMHELWEPVHDARIKRYFELTGGAEGGKARFPPAAPGYLGWTPQAVRKFMTAQLPFYPNLTPPQYIPTGSIALLDVLAKSFPKHRLVMADFDKLPDTIDGHNAPVVQTRLQGTMVPVTQYLVHQGFFDIFFPTNFGELQRMHSATMSGTGRSSSSSSHARSNHAPPASLSRSEVLPHSAFLRRYADLAATTCWDGSNPMLKWYANASWFLS